MPPALRLEQFAELSARMAGGQLRSDVLASAGISLEHWDATQQFWIGKMAEEAGKDRLALSNRYAALYKASVTKLQATKPSRAAPKRRIPVDRQKVIVHAMPAIPPTTGRVSAPPAAPHPVSMPPVNLGQVATPPSVAPPPSISSRVAHTARLTVEQLAAMRAELATTPEGEHASVRARFGLDPATWRLEEAHWQRALAGDNDLFARYLKQFQYCRSLLQRS